MLELVDEYWHWPETMKLGSLAAALSRVRAVKVEDGPVKLGRESSEQSALTHGARPGEDHDWLFAHALRDDFDESARAQPDTGCSAR